MPGKWFSNTYSAWVGMVLVVILLAFSNAAAAVPLVVGLETSFPSLSSPAALVYGPQGKYWFALAESGAIGEWNRSTALPVTHPLTALNAQPRDIVIGPDMALWFTEKVAGKIGRYEPGGVLNEFPLSVPTSQPSQLVTGQDGAIWFTLFDHNSIGRMTEDGKVQEYPLLHPDSRPLGLESDVNGNLWFTQWNGYRIGKITPAGVITEYPILNPPSRPTQITLGPDGAMWFNYELFRKVGRIDPATGAIANFSLPTSSAAILSLVPGADGRLWFLGAQTVGSFTASSTGPADLIEVALSSAVFQGQGGNQIIAGPNGQMTFIISNAQQVYQVGPVLPQRRDLQVFMSGMPQFLLAGGPFKFKASLANWSDTPATGVRLTMRMSEGLAFVAVNSTDFQCTQKDAYSVECTIASLPGNSVVEGEMTLLTTRNAIGLGDSRVELSVLSSEDDYQPANNRTYRDQKVLREFVYQTDFTGGPDSNWLPRRAAIVDGQEALGLFDNDQVALAFPNFPPHDTTKICFDLYVLGGWDGSSLTDPSSPVSPPPIIGPDIWANYLNERRLLVSSFSNRPGLEQSYPEDYGKASFPAQSSAAQTGNFDGDPATIDARYRMCTIQNHVTADYKLTFYGVNLDGLQGEKWALDHVEVRIYYYNVFDYAFLPMVRK